MANELSDDGSGRKKGKKEIKEWRIVKKRADKIGKSRKYRSNELK